MSRRTTDPACSGWLRECWLAGMLSKVGSMTVAEKIEQVFTGRPNSDVPGQTLARLINAAPRTGEQLWGLSMAIQYGQGTVAAVMRAVASYYGLRGPFTDFVFVGVRLMIDQTLENWTAVGAPPWTWPVGEQVIHLLHKAVYAFVTGYLTDRRIQ